MTARPFLDRPIARVVAGLCFLACAGILTFLHRDDLFPPEATAVANDPLSRCIAERTGQVDTMLRDKLIDEQRAALFRERAQALCAATHGQK